MVAGSLFLLVGTFHTSVYVGALLVEGREYSASVAVKLKLAAVVAYFVNHSSSHIHQVDVGFALDFAGNDYLSGGYKSFAGHL